MAAWLGRMFRKGAEQNGSKTGMVDRRLVLALTLGQVSTAPEADAIVERATATAPAPRPVVEELGNDPGAAELRAQWEARWEEF